MVTHTFQLLSLQAWTLSLLHFIYNYSINPFGTAFQIHTGFNHSLPSLPLIFWASIFFYRVLPSLQTAPLLSLMSPVDYSQHWIHVIHLKHQTNHIIAIFNSFLPRIINSILLSPTRPPIIWPHVTYLTITLLLFPLAYSGPQTY